MIAVVGVSNVEFFDHPDDAVEHGLALRPGITAAIRALRPEIIVTMNFELTWGDLGGVNHSDHRAVGLATIDACRDAANEWVFAERGASLAGHHKCLRGRYSDPHPLRRRDEDHRARRGLAAGTPRLYRGAGGRVRPRQLPAQRRRVRGA